MTFLWHYIIQRLYVWRFRKPNLYYSWTQNTELICIETQMIRVWVQATSMLMDRRNNEHLNCVFLKWKRCRILTPSECGHLWVIFVRQIRVAHRSSRAMVSRNSYKWMTNLSKQKIKRCIGTCIPVFIHTYNTINWSAIFSFFFWICW